MDVYSLSAADHRLEELIDRAEADETIDIQRGGLVVARLVPAMIEPTRRKPFDLAAYFESIQDLPVYPGNSVVDMRKEARY